MLQCYREQLYKLLSKEYNCTTEDFCKRGNILTVSAQKEGRRMYSKEKYFFHMVTLGGNAVLTAEECLHPFLKDFMKDRTGHWLFELPNLLPLQQELNRFGYTLTQTYHMFLPAEQTKLKKNYAVKWFFGKEEISQFYGDERFPNAICSEYLPHRPDKMVVCAYDGDKILEEGNIPFYGTSLSNYHSWNIALNCGFRPAWVEIGAEKIK